MSDIGFEQLLAQHNQEYKDAKEFSDWMPPDGEYVILVKDCDRGSKEKDGSTMLWWKHTAEVVAGDNQDACRDKEGNPREFGSMFVSSNNYGMAKSTAKILNGGTSPASSADLDRVLMGAQGQIIKVKIATKAGKNGQEYTNTYYQELVDADVPAEAPEPTPDESIPH